MEILIDANILSVVFSDNPGEYEPVLNGLNEGRETMVIGGTKYRAELRSVASAMRVVAELSKANRTLNVNDGDVDRLEDAIRNIVPPACDDPHLIALIGVSRCPVICTDDKRADKYLKDKYFYPWRSFAPKIYRAARNANVLVDTPGRKRCFSEGASNPHFEKFINDCYGCRQ